MIPFEYYDRELFKRSTNLFRYKLGTNNKDGIIKTRLYTNYTGYHDNFYINNILLKFEYLNNKIITSSWIDVSLCDRIILSVPLIILRIDKKTLEYDLPIDNGQLQIEEHSNFEIKLHSEIDVKGYVVCRIRGMQIHEERR